MEKVTKIKCGSETRSIQDERLDDISEKVDSMEQSVQGMSLATESEVDSIFAES